MTRRFVFLALFACQSSAPIDTSDADPHHHHHPTLDSSIEPTDASTDGLVDVLVDGCIVGAASHWSADSTPNDLFGLNTFSYAGQYDSALYDKGFLLDGKSFPQKSMAIGVNGTAAFTIELWVKATNVGASVNQTLVSNYDEMTTFVNWEIMLLAETSMVHFNGGGFTSMIAPLPTELAHIAYVLEGSTYKAYLNGALALVTSGPGTIPTSSKPVLRLGADPQGGTPFAGIIDELTIYPRALSAAEVMTIASAGLAKPPTPICRK